jgi:oligopeptide transport system ATP-binding protein
MPTAQATDTILELQEVRVHFPVSEGTIFNRTNAVVKAVDGVNLRLRRGEVLGLVGESGCGKSTLARAITRLLPVTSGRIVLNGRNIASLTEAELRRARREMQIVFQDPYSSLNPRMTVFDALAEPLLAHGQATKFNVTSGVVALMERVGLSARSIRKYPHEFSGGQRQRIAIARALALKPRLLIADEPVSALDVSIQAQILNLLANLSRELGLSMIFIAHDLSVVKHISDRIAVMYLGRVVEMGSSVQVIENPRHPYTRALISAIPEPDPARERERQRIVLEGDPPSPMNPPAGCPFHPRCPHRRDRCTQIVPPLDTLSDGRRVACIRVDEIT